MLEQSAILFKGYMVGVVFGSIMSVTFYKLLSKNEKITDAAETQPSALQEQVTQ